jgi:hypothetical protein
MTVASLTGQLLARKGEARPSIVHGREPRPARSAPPPEPARCVPAAAPQPAPAADPGPGAPDRRARLTLRLDPNRHRRLRLAAVHTERSLQQLMTAALDAYLAGLDLDCACVRSDAPACAAAQRAQRS